jgi:hypothetical protein
VPMRLRVFNGGPYVPFRKQVNRMIRTLQAERSDPAGLAILRNLRNVERLFMDDEHRIASQTTERSGSNVGESGGSAT